MCLAVSLLDRGCVSSPRLCAGRPRADAVRDGRRPRRSAGLQGCHAGLTTESTARRSRRSPAVISPRAIKAGIKQYSEGTLTRFWGPAPDCRRRSGRPAGSHWAAAMRGGRRRRRPGLGAPSSPRRRRRERVGRRAPATCAAPRPGSLNGSPASASLRLHPRRGLTKAVQALEKAPRSALGIAPVAASTSVRGRNTRLPRRWWAVSWGQGPTGRLDIPGSARLGRDRPSGSIHQQISASGCRGPRSPVHAPGGEQIRQLTRYLAQQLASLPFRGRPLVNGTPPTFNPVNKTMRCVMGGI